MKNGAQRRTRSRGGRRNNNTNNKTRVFDSNGPDVRIRGTAIQIVEKYVALAKDANAAGDIVAAQNFLQHAEHYQRIVNDWDDELSGSPKRFVNRNENDFDDVDDNIGNRAADYNGEGEDLGLPSSIIGKEAVVSAPKQMEVEPA